MRYRLAFGLLALVSCALLLSPLLDGTNLQRIDLWKKGASLLRRLRRLAVSSPQFSLLKPVGGNLADVSSSSSNVAVVAGPTYASLTIGASSGLGNSANTRVKLVSSSAVESECSTAVVAALAPLDGTVGPSSHSASSETYANVQFRSGGVFKICYLNPGMGAYELLAVTITVSGAIPSDDHFCLVSSSSDCSIKISGTNLGSNFRIGVISYSSTASCGSSALTHVFANQVALFDISQSTNMAQIHNFGKQISTSSASYLLCLCPGFDADSSGGMCQVGSTADFAQDIGKLFTMTVSANVTNIYNGLAVNLVVHCGAGLGGCASNYANRYKIVDPASANDAPAWNSAAGCGAALQTQHQVQPRNCLTSVSCQHRPAAANTLAPTWNSLLLEGRREGQQHFTTTFDVCYCNNNCMATTRWFKIGQIQVDPVTVLGPSIVNTLANVDLQGLGGSWITDGSALRREMKLLSDPRGSMSNRQCFQVQQSTQLVADHTCSSPVDCSPPYSATVGQTYIGVTVKAAGWVAVCYCNTQCGERANWFVQGHLLVAGPIPGQTWSFYTLLNFKLEVKGWKLATGNRILIIDSVVDCTAAGALQDPAISGPSTAVPVQSSGSVGDITSIVAHGSQSKITFANDHGLVRDARISITGITCTACTNEDSSKFNANHGIIAVLTPTEVLVDVTFSGSYPVVVPTSATWVRDDLQIFSLVKASKPGRYRVCWSSSVFAPRSVSATVGILHIASAPVMSATIHSSTIQPTKVAPVVLTFTTANSDRYQEAVGSMQLRIHFVNTMLLMPYLVDKTAVSANPNMDTLAEANQQACSLWILELGTARDSNGGNNELGWPMPRGCYFVQEGISWVFAIVFDQRNGLKQHQTYDIVFNAALGVGFATTSEVIQISSMDDVDYKLYDVLEAGSAVVGNSVATELRSGTDGQFHVTDGFSILNGVNGYFELTGSQSSFRAQLRTEPGTTILGEQLVRVFLRPFTQWVVGYSCGAVTCTPFSGQICGIPSCTTESVMKRWYHRNALRVKLPQGMTPITNVIKHWLDFTELSKPPGGFFPVRWGAEVQAEEGKKPDYVESTQALPYVQPAASVAAVVTSPGDGNLKPFYNDQSNTLYIKVMLGATLFAASAGDAIFRVVLPLGYECVSGGAAPNTLNIFSGDVPSANGILRDGTQIPSWTAVPASGAITARCELSFSQNMALYSGVMMYFAMTVNNPSTPLSLEASGNQWALELSAKGGLSTLVTAPLIEFASVNANLSRSVSVFGSLVAASIVPSNFVRGYSGNWLSIFFRTTQAVDAGGSVQVDSPDGFSVGDVCEVKDLPTYYYTKFDLALSEENSTNVTLRLPFTTCVGSRLLSSSSTNSARIGLASGLYQGGSYAFMLSIDNPLSYHSSQLNSWYIQTNSPNGFGIDRTFNTTRLNGDESPAAQSSWSMYNYQLGPSGFEVYVADMRPTGLPTTIRVFPIIFERDVDSSVRILAPVGYSWQFTAAEFVYRKYAVGLPVGYYVQGAEEDMPLSSPPHFPTNAPYNQLELTGFSAWLRWGVKYGFEAKVVLPQYTPSSSANVFILQVGYNSNASAGEQAAVAEAAFVRRISDVVVSYTTSLKAQENTIVIDFSTLTEIPVGGGLVVYASAGFTASPSHSSCNLSFASTIATSMPAHSCSLGNFADEAAAVLASEALPANAYRIAVPVRNPLSSGSLGVWRLASFQGLTVASTTITTQDPLDYEGSAPGFRVASPMQGAAIVSGQFCIQELGSCETIDQQYQKTGRDDRPGAQNNLIFSLNLTSNSPSGQFVIRAPEGFRWSAECTVVTVDVFGSFSTLPSNFSAWPNVSVSNCIGHNNVATFYVSHPLNQGFVQGELYVFRINSVTNPLAAPAMNLWVLEFGDEVSEPFPGFALWTCPNLGISSHTTSVASSNTITLHLSFLHEVPALGYVQIIAPGGYYIPHVCSLALTTAVAVQPWEINKIFYAGDFNCTGAGANTARLYLLHKSLLSGMQYVISLRVTNPSMVSTGEDAWMVSSFRRIAHETAKIEYDALDSGIVHGPTTNEPLSLFSLSPLPLTNALANVDWQFWSVFGDDLRITDKIEFTAPIGYILENTSANMCSQYRAMLGLPGTSVAACSGPCYHTASCSNNTMVLSFERCPSYIASMPFGVCIEKNTRLKFAIATQNPESTPVSNFFAAKHTTIDGLVRASSVVAAYHIIPLLGNPTVELVAAGTLNVISEAVGSQPSIRITYISNGLAQTVRINGSVAGESFRFGACTPKDGNTLQPISVNERENNLMILTLPAPVDVGGTVNLLMEGMGNPSKPGTSSWTITTYARYDAVLGPMVVINEKIGIVGFDVLGYISVLTTSTLTPRYYGNSGCAFSLVFRTSLPLGQGDFVDVVAPRNYLFESNLLNMSGDLMIADVSLIGSASSQASAFLGNYTMVNDVTPYLSTYIGAGGTASDLEPIYQKNDAAVFLYKLPGGQQWAIGPTPGSAVTGLLNEAFLSTPSLSGETAIWQVGNGTGNITGWLQVPDVYVSAIGNVTTLANNQKLSFRVGKELSAASTAKIITKLSLPAVEQSERNWRLEARHGSGKAYATNDLQYGGFNLVWQVSFVILPSLTAPKAQSTLLLAFDQERRLNGLNRVRYELVAPNSFRFPSSCLSVAEQLKGSGALFSQCVGSSNIAELVSTKLDSIKGFQNTLRVELVVNMPLETPLMNAWVLSFSLDASAVVQGSGSVGGFDIVPMTVSVKGNNQLGNNAPAYFTLMPLRVAEVGSSIHILPPVNQRYRVSCYPVVQVNLPALPNCGVAPTTGALVLTLQSSTKEGGGQLNADRNYTVGVGVTNNGRSIPDTMNRWTVVLYDSHGKITDSNYAVQGVQLRSFRMSVENAVLQTPLSDGTYQVVIKFSLTHALAAGLVSQLRIIPPSNFAISNQWKVPSALPTSAAPSLVSGNLEVPLMETTIPAGSHSIEVTGTASSDDVDNTWTFLALKGNEVVHQHVLSGLTS